MKRECPRCGYDLSGEINSWSDDAWPVHGVCSECGLDLQWGEILDPSRSMPLWFVEHPRGVSVERTVQTYARAFWPWRFWRAVRIEHAVNLRVLSLFAGLSLLLAHLGFGFVSAGAFYITKLGFNRTGFSPSTAFESMRYLAWPYSNVEIGGVTTDVFALVLVAAMLAVALAMPLSFLSLASTLAKAKVRRVHLLRGFVLTLPIITTGTMITLSLFHTSLAGWVDERMVLTALLATGVIHTAAWWVIVRQYLRLEHPLAVTIAVTIIAWLTGFTLLLTVGQSV